MVLFLEQGASAVDAKWKYPLVAEMKSDALTGNVIRTMEEAFDTNGRLSECAFSGGFRLPESHKQVSCLLWSRVWIAHQCLHHYFGLQGPFCSSCIILGYSIQRLVDARWILHKFAVAVGLAQKGPTPLSQVSRRRWVECVLVCCQMLWFPVLRYDVSKVRGFVFEERESFLSSVISSWRFRKDLYQRDLILFFVAKADPFWS